MDRDIVGVQETGAEEEISATLLRLLLECAGSRPVRLRFSPAEEPSSGELVFHVCLDGLRYILVVCRADPDTQEVRLSPRESEIIHLVAKGLPNKAIAAVLEISPWAVSTHLRRAFTKLGVCSRAQMVARAMQESLFGDDGTAEGRSTTPSRAGSDMASTPRRG